MKIGEDEIGFWKGDIKKRIIVGTDILPVKLYN